MAAGSLFPLIDVFLRHDVPFVVIGGHAVNFHGLIRTTEPVDIVFQRSAHSEQALLSALLDVNAQWIGTEIDSATRLEFTYPVSLPYVQTTSLMMLVTDYGYLDVFDFIPGFPESTVDEVIESGIQTQRGTFVSLSWLRKMKAVTSRSQDRLDLENLRDW